MPRHALVKDFIIGVKRRRDSVTDAVTNFRTDDGHVLPMVRKYKASAKRRTVRRSRYPVTRSRYRMVPGTLTRAKQYGTYIPGSMRVVRASAAGQETPLYVAPRIRNQQVEACYNRSALDGFTTSVTWQFFTLNCPDAAGKPSPGYPQWARPGEIRPADGLSSTRQGRIINMTDLIMRYCISFNKGNTAIDQAQFRIAIVYQRQTWGQAMGITDVFEPTIPGKQWYDFRNTSFRDKFDVLYDRTHVVFAPPANGSEEHVDLRLKLDGRPMQFDGTAHGDIANVTQGILYVFFVAENGGPAPGAADHTFEYSAQVTYSP